MGRKAEASTEGASIEVRGLNQSYDGTRVLKDVGFRVGPGEFVGIIGPNGSGKTTLLHCITGHIPREGGVVRLSGRDVEDLDSLAIARMVGVVPQQTSMDFDFTVLEVVLMGRYPHIDRFSLEDETDLRVAEEALRATGVHGLMDRFITELSGGERQRVIIARALTQEPRILLLDEPTSHLDIRHQLEVMDLIKDLNRARGLTVLSVFHDLNLAARYCDRLLLLDKGRVVSDGGPETVLTVDNLRSTFGVEVRLRRTGTGGTGIEVLDLS